MKHIPILFSTPMVQALLEGRKTQTRRVVKASPMQRQWLSDALINNATISLIGDSKSNGFGVQLEHPLGGPLTFIKCPYGQPGDVLWVREVSALSSNRWRYKADYDWTVDEIRMGENASWKPSIHMPKRACRLWLKVKAVRVEKLMTISGEDAVAEGVTTRLPDNGIAQNEFHELWKSIHGPEGLYSNPWVWVIEFERCEMPEDFLQGSTSGKK